MAPGQTIPLTSHPWVLKSSFTVTHLLTVPLSRRCHLYTFTEILGTLTLLWVFCFSSPLSQHIICYLRVSYRTLSSTHVIRECWSSSALSIWEYHAFVIFLVPQVGWYVPRDCWRRWGCHGSLRLGSEPPFLTFSQEYDFITVSTLPPLPSETLACYEGNESHMFLIHLHVAHQNVVL